MNNANTKGQQERQSNGQYGASLERICKNCGSRFGVHAAVRPYPQEDMLAGPICVGFKATPKAKVAR